MQFEPELMRLANGLPVLNAEDMAARRKELLHILEQNAYGVFPAPVPVTGKTVNMNTKCCSGSAAEYRMEIECDMGGDTRAFPLTLFLPNGEEKKPLIVLINFHPSPFNEYVPLEEIIDNGFALAHICYEDVTADNADFTDGFARYFPRESPASAGKIGIWAWGVCRALDYLLTLGRFREDAVGVIGHSRLGKTALWCGANDPRFRFVCSNDSGCMGAAYARSYHEGGEPVSSIAEVFPYWFCERFLSLSKHVPALPFDQHFLVSCVAPRSVLVNSAAGDIWADPVSEQNVCVGASPAWRAYGHAGFTGKTEPYGSNEGCTQGDIGYFKRNGIHFLGRRDWLQFMRFIQNRINAPDRRKEE